MKIAVFLVVLAVIVSVESKNKKKPAVCPEIKTKLQWGGDGASEVDYQTIPVEYVIVHHTGTRKCVTFQECAIILRDLQFYQMSIGYNDIGFNFLIGNDGNIYEGCGWHKVCTHTYGYNHNGTAIAFIGDFYESPPTTRAYEAAKQLLQCGVELGELDRSYKLFAARQVQSTISPGLDIYNEIQTWDNWSEAVF